MVSSSFKLALTIAVLSIVGVALVLFFVWSCFRRRHCVSEHKEVRALPQNAAPSCSLACAVTSSYSTTLKVEQLVAQVSEDNLRELLQERLADLGHETEELQNWALSLVNLLDELRLMQPSYSPHDAAVISQLSLGLIQSLSERGGELIDLNVWTPEQQRATRIVHQLPEGASPQILSKGALGLIVNKRLIRKQEVTLNLPPQH